MDAAVVVLLWGPPERILGQIDTISLTHVTVLLDMPVAPSEPVEIRLGGERMLAEVQECRQEAHVYEVVCGIVEWQRCGCVHSVVQELTPLMR